MRSRYDFMTESTQLDIDGSHYPDPLSLNYNGFDPKTALTPIELDDESIRYFWWTTYKVYKTAEYDDLVLTLNGVPHKNFLVEDQVIYFPAITDFQKSFMKTGLL